jgi:hypothetical protein
MNKKAFIDADTFSSGGFWILVALGWSATIIGYKMSLGFDSGALPLWQVIMTLVVIFFASAFFAQD